MSGREPFFRPGGTMEPGAPSYIERQADGQLFEALLAREYVYLLDSRQKGKSSMVARTIVKLREHDVTTVKLDLQRIGSNVTPEQWYAGMLAAIGQELELSGALFEYWGAHQSIGPLARWVSALEEVVLACVVGPIVVFVDEVDFVRALPFPTDEFFAAIRDCYNRRSENRGFERLTFCLVGVATPAQLIRNPEITPFNIGTRIELSDFTMEESQSYAKVLAGADRDGGALLLRVHHWLNGHPYLTQLLCSLIAADPAVRSASDVDRLVRQRFLQPEARQREPNFSDVERRMLEPDVPGLSGEEKLIQVLELYGKLLRGKPVEATEENPIVATLRLAGVGLENRRELAVRNRLYRQVFDEEWRRTRLPDAELRRQRGAARLAMLRTAAVAGVVIVAVSAGAIGVLKLSNDRQRALTSLKSQSDRLRATSGERERALSALEERNKSLRRVSSERERALAGLERQNEELRRISREKEEAISNLKQRSIELSHSNYVGNMAIASIDLPANRWNRFPAILEETKLNVNRGWEWGFFAKMISFDIETKALPRWSILEPQSDGSVLAVAPEGLFRTDGTRPQNIRDFHPIQPFVPCYRRGPFRVVHVELPRGHEIHDAESDRRLIASRNYAMILDVDPRRRIYLLVRGTSLEKIEVRTIDGDKSVMDYVGPDETDAARFLPDGTILSTSPSKTPQKGEIRHWNLKGKTLSQALSDQQFARGLSVSPDGKKYAAWGFDGKVEVRWVEDHRKICALPNHPKLPTDLTFSPDGRLILTGSEDGCLRLFNGETGVLDRRLLGFRNPIRSACFTHGGKGVAAVDSKGFLRTWDHMPRPALEEYRDFNKHPLGAALSADSKRLYSLSFEGEMVSRELSTGKVIRRTIRDPKAENCVARPRDGHDIFIGRPSGRVERYDAQHLRLVQSQPIFDSPVEVLEWFPKGNRLLAGSKSKKFAILDAASFRVIARIEPVLTRKAVDRAGVKISDQVAFDKESPQFALFLGEVGKIQIYAASDGRLIREWDPGRTVLKLAFAIGGKELVASLGAAWYVRDGETLIYEVSTGREIHEITHEWQTLNLLEYSPQSGVLAAGTSDREYADRAIYLYDMKSRTKFAEMVTEPFIYAVSFAPDGQRILTLSEGFGARLWETRTGIEVFRLPYNGISRFTEDGTKILQLFGGGVRIWSADPWQGTP